MQTLAKPLPIRSLPRPATARPAPSLAERLQASCTGAWIDLTLTKPALVSPRTGAIGSPGLWKPAPANGAGFIFTFPESILESRLQDDHDEMDAEEAPKPINLETMGDWALAAAAGTIPEGWTPPGSELLADWLPAPRRSLRQGALVRELEIIAEPERFALRVALARFPASLPAGRRAWLERFLASAGERWRLVRFGLSPDGLAALAEIDLTGAPRAARRPLFQAGVDSMRWIVASLAATADFLAHPQSVSQALDHFSAVA